MTRFYSKLFCRMLVLLAVNACGGMIDLALRDAHGGLESSDGTVLAVLQVLPPEETASGTTLIELLVAGSPDELASLRVEYDVLGDQPDRGWRVARAVEDERTEDCGIRTVRLDPQGTNLAFFWDTDADLPDRDVRVRLRVTALAKSVSAPRESGAFWIDNE